MGAITTEECHVLVIGSGGAGIRAALEAARYGETILVGKSVAGKGGCTVMAEGGYNAVLRETDTISSHLNDTLKGGAFLNDRALAEVLVNEAPNRIDDLLRFGAVFDAEDSCTIAQRPFGGQAFARTCYAGDRTGHEIVMTLLERLRASDIRLRNEITALELATDQGRVCGAFTATRDGDIGAIAADAVVLATGGCGQIYDITTNSTTGTGDGYALGYRAGAELIDMEMVQFHPTGAVHPYDARGRLITEAVRGEGGILKNSEGERFMARYDPERMELSTRDVVARSIATEVLEGRGTPRGGVWLDVTHLSSQQIEERLPLMLEQFLKFGVDIRTEPMEVAPTAHHMMGGLRITPECRTTVPGLFACGEVAGGVHGANRLGGNALAETQVFGRRAGEAAGKEKTGRRRIDPEQAARLEEQLASFEQGDTRPSDLAGRLKRVMWDGAGIYRDAARLTETREAVLAMSSITPSASSGAGIMDAWTIRNMLLVAGMILDGALLRQESRGAHVRVDCAARWDPVDSPYGHTRIAQACRCIEVTGRIA
ncbi:MAG: fumarate reductase subunit A [Methanocalculus sp. MSAO_Arc1]|uniref:fumarate reductase (CoM/CoB) subunit TfrA n=1 Tax=Methanocalculus TaxID=71151 RepID=UPI000FF5A767|nr:MULTISPECIES: fumarate reductase (CoM/CoB) subunit TfrA [unclassified Methanocalculus]MCP1661450.1 fumarate reductase (CoM/CoB) subunit A [Methanocalculus sp. AMF5]RQD79265.1 MAG: fumarate reductase subunit A [Methanocalculus sp. MSAO_Arc1]